MKCFGYLVVLLANHLVETIGKVIANWSLDTVNTLPLALARQGITVNRTIASGNKLTHLENVFDHDEKLLDRLGLVVTARSSIADDEIAAAVSEGGGEDVGAARGANSGIWMPGVGLLQDGGVAAETGGGVPKSTPPYVTR